MCTYVCVWAAETGRPTWINYIRSLRRGHETNSRRARRRSVLEEQTHSSHPSILPSIGKLSISSRTSLIPSLFEISYYILFLSFWQGVCSNSKEAVKMKGVQYLAGLLLLLFVQNCLCVPLQDDNTRSEESFMSVLYHLYSVSEQ